LGDVSGTAKDIYEGALLRLPTERASYLENACGGNPKLRSEVEALLQAASRAEDGSSEATLGSSDQGGTPHQPPRFVLDELLSERFRIKRLIGRGGMGDVYEALDERLNHRVALKAIRSGAASDAALARLRHEVVLARQVTHPNVCRIFDIGQHTDQRTGQDVAYLTMELLDGETLSGRIRRLKKLTAEVALPIALQMAEAVAAAHAVNVIHRDLKPSNIILVPAGVGGDRAVVTDFGLARLAEEQSLASPLTLLTGSGEILGTILYMAPEQIRGQSISTVTDIYALGLIIYEMLCGRRAFGDYRSLGEIFRRMDGAPKPLRFVVADVDPRVDALVMHCLEVDPERRFPGAKELASAIRQIVGEKAPSYDIPTTSGSSTGRMPPLTSEVRRRLTLDSAGPTSPLQIPIAVLPFANLGPETGNEYFSEGLGEELMGALGKVPGLRLAARTSSYRFRGNDYDIREVGRLLNVDAVLEGSVRRSGSRLRVTVQLVDTAEGYQLWSERYDRQMEDVFAMQEEIANAVVSQLKVRLTDSAQSYFRKHRAGDIEAYNLYLKGRYFWNKRTPADLVRAVEHFKQATELDLRFAPAFAGLGDSYVTLAMYGAKHPAEVFPQAKQAIAQALKLDAKLSEAYCTDGCIRAVFDWDWSGAEQSFLRSLDLGPDYATGHHWLAINYFVPMKRFAEAQKHLHLARETDPLSLAINTTIGLELFFEGRVDEAITEYRRVLDMEPGFAMGYFFLGQALERQQRYQDALAALKRAVDLSNRSAETLTMLGHCYAAAGQPELARSMQNELSDIAAREYVSPVLLAQLRLALGSSEDALTLLEQAHQQRATDLLWIRLRPAFEPLSREPRFQAIAESIGLP
jgi:serine/threonine-protein kinase